MTRFGPCLAALLVLLAAPVAGEVTGVVPLSAERAPSVRPLARGEDGRRCAAGGRVCIAERSYAEDVCRAIEAAAGGVGLDVGFFARLLWRESLFDAGAISPAGAQGIAQFMPGTAALRGLRDPFNPAEAILASADYLKDLEKEFGSLGLAAVAYNAGEERAAKFLAGNPFLPRETRAYVVAITGHGAEAWRAGAVQGPDLALDPETPFREACVAKASARAMPSFEPPAAALSPWAVVIAGRDSRDAAEAEAQRLVTELPALAGERVAYTHERFPGMQVARHFAQVGRNSRGEADTLCGALRAQGAGCIVRRN